LNEITHHGNQNAEYTVNALLMPRQFSEEKENVSNAPGFISSEFFSLPPNPDFSLRQSSNKNNNDNSSLRPNCQKPRMKKITPPP